MKFKLLKLLNIKKTVAVATSLCFLFTMVFSQGLSAAIAPTALPVVNKNIFKSIENYLLPFSVGRITDALYTGGDEIVINIQDLHSHAQAQRNISNILSILDKKYGLKNVYVEGGIGQVDTSWLSSISDEKLKEVILNNMLESGRLTGGEYYSVETNKNKLLLGIEDKDTYINNLKRLNEIYSKKQEILKYVSFLKYTLNEISQNYYSRDNLKLNRVISKHKAGNLSAEKYFTYLLKAAQKANINLKKYPNIVAFLKVLKKQDGLDTKKVNLAIAELLNDLKSQLPYDQYQTLLSKVSDKNKETEFYFDLYKVAKEKGLLEKSDYRTLLIFFEYLSLNQNLNPVNLTLDEKGLLQELNIKLSKNQNEKNIYFLQNYLEYFSGYLTNKLTADDYEYFINNMERFKLLWKKYVDINGIIELDYYLNLFNDFYKDNVERNRFFIKNIIGQMPNQPKEGIRVKANLSHAQKVLDQLSKTKKVKVVITGGFHTYGFTKLLQDKNISYIVITPNVKQQTVSADVLYENIFKEQVSALYNTLQKMLVSQIGENAILNSDLLEALNATKLTAQAISILNKALADNGQNVKVTNLQFEKEKATVYLDNGDKREIILKSEQEQTEKEKEISSQLDKQNGTDYKSFNKITSLSKRIRELNRAENKDLEEIQKVVNDLRNEIGNVRADSPLTDYARQFNNMDKIFSKENVVLIGPSGSGKSTTVNLVAETTGAEIISFDDLIKEYLTNPSKEGKKLKEGSAEYNKRFAEIKNGSGAEIAELLDSKIKQSGSNNRIFVDGFGRNAEQIDTLKNILGAVNTVFVYMEREGENALEIGRQKQIEAGHVEGSLSLEEERDHWDNNREKVIEKLKTDNIEFVHITKDNIIPSSLIASFSVNKQQTLNQDDKKMIAANVAGITEDSILKLKKDNILLQAFLTNPDSLSESEKKYIQQQLKENQKNISFGTAGHREQMPEKFNPFIVVAITYGCAQFIKENGLQKKVLVGNDTRYMGDEYAKLVALTLRRMGIEVDTVEGSLSTPAISNWAKNNKGYGMTINITASHNPLEYNGYKPNTGDGAPCNIEDTDQIQHFAAETEPNKILDAVSNNTLAGENVIKATKTEPSGLNKIQLLHKNNVEKIFADSLGIKAEDLKGIFKGDIFIDFKNSALTPELLNIVEYVSDKKLSKDNLINFVPDVSFGYKNPEPNERNTQELKNKVENKANEKLKEGKSIEEIKKTTFGIATDPDGDRFAIYYTVYNGSKFEAKFLSPDEAGMIVQKIFLENKYNKLNEYLKANHSDKEISNWLKENNYNIVTVRSADTTSQIDKLAKYYEDKMKKLVSGQLKNEINVSVKITDIGFKNLAEAAKLTEKEGIEPLMLLESSGGLVSGLYDKDGLTATLLPLLLLNNASVTVEEELDTIEKDIKNSELLGRDAIVFEDKKELTAEQQKQNFLDVTNNFKDIYKNIPEMKNYDVETISPVTIENGIEIVFKNGNSLIVRASGTEPKIRIYTKVNATIENKSQLKKENDALMNLGRTLVEKSGNGEYKNYISKTQTVDNNKTIINKLTDYSSKTNNAKNRELLNDQTRNNKLIREMSVGKNNKLQLDFSRTELDEETLELCNNLYDNLDISEKLANIDMDEDVKKLLFAMYVYYHKVKGINILSVLPYDNNSAYIPQNAAEKLSDYLTVLGQPGTNGQHSFYQLLHQGVVPSFNAFVGFANSTDDIMADSDKKTAHFKLLSNMIAQADAFFIGRNRQETNSIEKDKNLQPHKVFEGNTPSLVMMFENNDEAAKKELTNIGTAIAEIAKAVETEPALTIKNDKSVKGEYKGFTENNKFQEIQKEKSASDKETVNQKNSKLTFKSNISTSLVNKYIELFKERKVFDNLKNIFNGVKVNATEGRAVLHSALRNVEFVNGKFVAKSAIEVDGKNVMPNVVNTLNKMTDFANRVINGQWKGATGKEIKTVVSIGIGGSDLGPRGVTNILADSKLNNAPEVRYVSNVDPQDLENQLKGLDPETTLFIIESKTFTTDETMTNANAAKKWLLSNPKLNEDSVKNHFVAVSTAKEEVEKFGIDTNNMFEFWDWVGGRFSVWSAIGLPVMLSIGPKNFADFLKGANNTDEALKEVVNKPSIAQDNVSVLAAISYIDRINHLGKQEQFINAPFDFFVDFIQQQSMESLGKFVTVDGKTVAYPTGNVIVPSANAKNGGINVAIGETSNNKYSSDDVTTYIDMDELSPESLGELFATFEHVVEISAALWEINAFDQWGVQLGKELMPGVLSAIEGEQTEQAKNKLNLSSQKNVEFINNANANETSKTSFIDEIKNIPANVISKIKSAVNKILIALDFIQTKTPITIKKELPAEYYDDYNSHFEFNEDKPIYFRTQKAKNDILKTEDFEKNIIDSIKKMISDETNPPLLLTPSHANKLHRIYGLGVTSSIEDVKKDVALIEMAKIIISWKGLLGINDFEKINEDLRKIIEKDEELKKEFPVSDYSLINARFTLNSDGNPVNKNIYDEGNIIKDEAQPALKEVQNQLDEIKLQLQVLDRTSKRSKSVPGAGINEDEIEEQIQELNQKKDELEAKIKELKNANTQLDLGFGKWAPVIESPMLFISLFVPAFRKNFIEMHNYSYENNIKGAYKDFFTRKTTNGTERDKRADIREIGYGINFVSVFTFAFSLFVTTLVGIVLGNGALYNLINYVLLFAGLSYPLSIAFHHIWNSFMDFLGTPESKLDLSLGDKISKFFKDVYEKRIVVDQVPDPIVTEYIIKNKNKDTDTFANEEEAIYRKLKNAQQRLEQIKIRLEAIDRVKAKVPASAKTFDNDEDVSLLNKEKDELEKEIIPSLEEELNKIQNAQLDLGLFSNMFKNRSTLRAVFAGLAESLILVPVTVVDTIQKALTGNLNNDEYIGYAGQWFLNAHGARYKNNLNKKAMEIGLNRVEKTTAIFTVAAAVATVFVAISLFLGSGDVAAHNLVNGLDIPSTISLTDVFKYIVFALFGSNILSHSIWNIFNPGSRLDFTARYSNRIENSFDNIEKYVENNPNAEGKDLLNKLISIKSNVLNMYTALEELSDSKQIYELTEYNETENNDEIFDYEWITAVLSGEYEQTIKILIELNIPEIKDDVDELYNSLANVEESGFMGIEMVVDIYKTSTNSRDKELAKQALLNMQQSLDKRIFDIEQGKQKADAETVERLKEYKAQITQIVKFETIKDLINIYSNENASYVEREKAREQLNEIKGTIDIKNINEKISKFKKQGFNINEDDLILKLNINTSDRVTVKSVNDDVKDSIDEFSNNLKNKIEEFYSNNILREKEGYQDYKNFIEKTIIPIYIESITGSRIINYLDNQIAASNIKTKEYYDGVAKEVKQIQNEWLKGKYNYGENEEELMTMLEIIDRGISKVEQGKDIYNLIEKDRKTNLFIEARDSVRQIIATETMREILLDEVSDKNLRKQIEKAKSKEELDLILANIAQTDQKTVENIVSRLDIKKSLIDINGENLVGKTIGLVVDLNAPLDSSKTKVTDPTRIESTLRTIKYLTDRGANVVLMSHLGRPTDEKNIEKRYKEFNMKPIAEKFKEFGIDVDFKNASSKETYSEYIDRVNLSIDKKTQGKVVLLDNLRFDERYSDKETKSQMADQFINKLGLDGVVFDAFGVSHRNNFSREMIQKVNNKEIGAVSGFLVEKELSEFAKVENPKHPFVAILGGSKVSDKIGVIENLLDKMTAGDTIVIGGAMAYTFLKVQGHEIGKSLVEDDKLDLAIKLQKAAEEKGVNLLLPVDHVVTSGLDFGDVNNNEADKTEGINIPKDKMGADIGPKTVEKIESVLEKVGKNNGTIVWNGPSGVFEIPVFAEGTTNVAKAVAQATDNGAFSMIGGGDSVSAANQAGVADRISHISTGGGASLNLLEGNSSPLIEVIPSKFQKEIDEVKNTIKSASKKDAVEQKTQKVDQAKYAANEIVSINIKESNSKEIEKFINETADKLQQENNWSDEGTKIFKNYMFARIAQIKGDSSDELLDFESFTPTAWQKEGVNFDGVITNLDNLKDEKYIKEAKNVDVGVYLMNGGIGSSIEREDYLVSINWYKEQIEKINNPATTQQEKNKIEEQINKVFNNETSIKNILGNKYESYRANVELAAKADDLYFKYKDENSNTRLISITELKNNSYSQQVKNGEFKTLKETILVSPDSLKPVEASIAGNPIMQKTLGLSTLMQEKYPVSRYNEETGSFEILVGKNYPTAPGGHGVWFATIWSQIINNNYDNGHISFVGNSDALAARPDQSVVGYMEKENVGIVMLAAEREASDAKGGIFGLFKNRLTLGEIAQFEAVGQEDVFEDVGLVEGDDAQAFNTNSIYTNDKLLKDLYVQLKKIGKTDADIEQMMQPDLIVNGKEKDGIGKYDQLEGALGASVLNFNLNLEKLRKENKDLDDWMNARLGKNQPLVQVVMASKQDREEVFTPIKKAFDFWKQATNWVVVNGNNWLTKSPEGHGTVNVSVKNSKGQAKQNYKDVSYFMDNWTNDDISELNKLSVDGYNIKLQNLKLEGEVIIENETDKEFIISKIEDLLADGITTETLKNYGIIETSLNDFEYDGKGLSRTGTEKNYLVLKDVKIVKTEKGIVIEKINKEPSNPVDAATAQTTGVAKTLNDLLQRLAVNAYSLFKEKPEIVAVVGENDTKTIEKAKQLAKQGIKVNLVLVGDSRNIINETGTIATDSNNNLSFELVNNDTNNLNIYSYESVDGQNINVVENVLEKLGNINKTKKVLYVSSELMKQGQNEATLNSAVMDNEILTYSQSSISEAVVQGLVAYKNKDKALNTVVSFDSIIANYDVDEEIDYETEKETLDDQKISRVMIKINNENDIEKAKEKVEKFNETGIADVIVVLDNNGTYEIVSKNEDSNIVNYEQARKMTDNIDNTIVYIGSQEQSNLILTADDMKNLIDKGAVLAFDADILNYMDSESTRENGVTLLGIIKSIFEQSSPEAKKNRAIEKGINIVKDNKLGSIKEDDLIKGDKVIISDKLLSLLEQLKIKVVTREEQELVALGIIQALELQKIDNNLLENLNEEMANNANELLTMLGEYRILKGTSFKEGDGRDKIKGNENINTILTNLRQEYKTASSDEEKAAAIAGIIEILLTDRLNIANDIENLTDNMDVKNIAALLSAA